MAPQNTDAIVLPRGYTWDRIATWGDALFAGEPSFTARDLANNVLLDSRAAERQARQFGANCDAVAFFASAGGRGDRGVLCVNNEYVQPELSFRGRRRLSLEPVDVRRAWVQRHPQAVAAMIAAHGVSVIEVGREPDGWQFLRSAPLTRRITASTPCEITGPARGAPLLRTRADPDGTLVLGTLANCAGGTTPWGTYLTAEENVDDYFGTRHRPKRGVSPELSEALRRFPLREHSFYGWEYAERRFDARVEPHEALRFGWIVEIDPHDPESRPRKLTALGRFSHEGATTTLARDGRVVVYMGDDDTFEYVYKFVSRRAFDAKDPRANRSLLDDGTLYVARFDADGTGEWLPLTHDERGPLRRSSGFANQADIVIRARAAADLLGATPMDRPEDIAVHPETGRVYIACTRNAERHEAATRAAWMGREIDLGVNAANPRPANMTGHILELDEHEEDAAAASFRWNIFMLAGDPRADGASFLTDYADVARERLFAPDTYYAGFADRAAVSPMACPDNLGIDPEGRLWVVTDNDNRTAGNNGCFVTATQGAERGALRQILSAPLGSEVCGCEFTPDGTTVFLTIQHPGEGGTLEEPRSHWPDGGDLPARAALIAVRREDGDPV